MIADLFSRYAWRMAWRDSRRARGRLVLYVLAMTTGVASLVAVASFRENLATAIAAESKELLGADYRLRSQQPFDDATEQFLAPYPTGRSSGVRVARQLRFSSMAAFGAGGQRLVEVRGLEGEFPFYGDLETDPPIALATFRAGDLGRDVGGGRPALVDAALMTAYDLSAGDLIKIGAFDYTIAGTLEKTPGESSLQSIFGPRVYLPYDAIDSELLSRGSRIRRDVYFAFDDANVGNEFEQAARLLTSGHDDLRLDTVASTQANWSETLDNLNGFLSLVGFVALLLGGLGVGSAVSVYVRQKIPTIATLRCLGSSSSLAFSVHLVQAMILAAIGATAGCILGAAVQHLIPAVLADLLPVTVETRIDATSIAIGLGMGLVVAFLFTLLPLLPIRKTPPLLAIRADDAESDDLPIYRDPSRCAVIVAILLFILLFARLQTGVWSAAGYYTAGVVVALATLATTAHLLIALARRIPKRSLPYVVRQGLANLHRPHNQTPLLLISIGLGAFLILTLHQARTLLLAQLDLSSSGAQPNIVLFDIQDPQLEEVTTTVAEFGVPVIESVPIVAMRIAKVNGETTTEIREREGRERSNWVYRREYRSTYRDAARPYERVVEGTFDGHASLEDATIPVSMERRQAERLGVTLGDTIEWDVQGIPIASVVTSIREVDWRQFRANFFAVFPAGVLEDAPKFHVITTRADDADQIGRMQRTLVERFPNVSVIDITLIQSVAEELMSRVSFAIEFMALFSIVTGFLVLIGSVMTTRYQRITESALLRTLGASRRQVRRITAVEYLAIGLFATGTGALLSIGATFMLARFQFDAPFAVAWGTLAVSLSVILAVASFIGAISNRHIHDRPPLEILRAEG